MHRRTVLSAAALALASPAVLAENHVATRIATHMELKRADGSVACGTYYANENTRPSCEVDPGTYQEQLFNDNWDQVGWETVTVYPDSFTNSSPRGRARAAAAAARGRGPARDDPRR